MMLAAALATLKLPTKFTITVLETIEDLGFCEKGDGGKFVMDGALQAPFGRLPFNTDGGGLCNNHPANRGGITKVIEAVRQLRDEAAPEVHRLFEITGLAEVLPVVRSWDEATSRVAAPPPA